MGCDTSILKFGSSVLRSEADMPAVVTEIYREFRSARTVIAVVSAFEGVTDQLLKEALEIGLEPGSEAFVRMLSTGEYGSAQALIEYLDEIGISASILTPRELDLVALGLPMHSVPISVDIHRLNSALEQSDVIVVPGFSAIDDTGETVLLGRGGSDMTAIFLASMVQAKGVRLIKDVAGVYETDPNVDPRAKRYERIDWEHASRICGDLVQAGSISLAADCGVEVEVAALGQVEGTKIGSEFCLPSIPKRTRPLRVAIAGCGTVGGGVWDRLTKQPDRYEITSVMVRDLGRHQRDAPFVSSPERLLHPRPDVVIEAINGEGAVQLLSEALSSGIAVVSANKQAVSTHFNTLTKLAHSHGAALKYSAAVGGAAPILETVDALSSSRRITQIDAVLNSTVNFICSLLMDGVSFPDALEAARFEGYCAAEPRDDLSGRDALAKAKLIAHHAFPDRLEPIVLSTEGLCGGSQAERLIDAGRLKQVATISPNATGRVGISISMQGGSCDSALMGLRGCANGALIHFKKGESVFVSANGAGRVPATESVLGDLGEIERALIKAGELDIASGTTVLRPRGLNGTFVKQV